jgi:LPS O-antigen subunit length determinant protein (WzzB/FepE family)
MTDQKTLQQTSNVNYQYPAEEEISFIDILAIIVKKKGLIFFYTFISTLISIAYLYIATPIYVATISFLPPAQETYLSSIDLNLFTKAIDSNLDGEKGDDKKPESSSKILNKLNSDKFLYRQFLTRVQSYNQQKEVLSNKNISEKFFGKSPDIESIDQRFINLHNSISFNKNSLQSKKETIPLDRPAALRMEGSNPIAMAAFLNTLADSTKTAIIKETQDSLKTLVDNRFNIAKRTKEQLHIKANLKAKSKANNDHLNKIKDYSDKIQALSDSLKIAQSLNIKSNNFHLLEKNEGFKKKKLAEKIKQKNKKGLMRPFKDGLIPQWFLYGEKALIEEIKVTKSRINQIISNPPETAQNLNKNSNNLLNKNNNNYIDGFADLEDLINQLKSFKANTLIPKVVLVEQSSIPPTKTINLKVEKALPIGIGLGLLIGIIAAFLSHSMAVLRNKETTN